MALDKTRPYSRVTQDGTDYYIQDGALFRFPSGEPVGGDSPPVPAHPVGPGAYAASRSPGPGDVYPPFTRWLDTTSGTIYTSTEPGQWSAGASGGGGISESQATTIAQTQATTAASLAAADKLPFAATVAQLRTLSSSPHNLLWLCGYATSGDGGEGFIWKDPADTTTPDNGGTVFVAGSVRWRRGGGATRPAHWGIFSANADTVNGPRLQAMLDWARTTDTTIDGDDKVYETDRTLTVGEPGITLNASRMTLKQGDNRNLECVLKISAAGTGNISQISVQVDGNRANNPTSSIGCIIRDQSTPGCGFSIAAVNCATGLVLESSCERTTYDLAATECTLGLHVRGGFTPGGAWETPDQANITLESNNCREAVFWDSNNGPGGETTQVTGKINLFCEGVRRAIRAEGTGELVISGVMRGVGYVSGLPGDALSDTEGGIEILGNTRVVFDNTYILGKNTGNGWAVILNTTRLVTGSVRCNSFGGGVWAINAVSGSSLQVNCEAADTMDGIRLGRTGEASRLTGFVLTPGSGVNGSCPGGTCLRFLYTSGCIAYISSLSPTVATDPGTGQASSVVFDAGSNLDTVELPFPQSTRRVDKATGSTAPLRRYRGGYTAAARDAIPGPWAGTVVDWDRVLNSESRHNGTAWETTLALGAKPTVTTITTVSSTARTLVVADEARILSFTSSGAITLTVPPNSSAALPVGCSIRLQKAGAGNITVAPGAGVTINAAGGLTVLGQAFGEAVLTKTATDTWWLSGAGLTA